MRKDELLARASLMVARSGIVASAQRRMFGRDQKC